MEYQDITQKIIGGALGIYGKMSYGFLQSVYEKCMFLEFKKTGLKFETQKKSKGAIGKD